MKIFIRTHQQTKQFEFQPLYTSGLPPSTSQSSLVYSVRMRGRDHLALAFVKSRKAQKRLLGTIRYGAGRSLFLNEWCLGLGVLCHPKGWPDCQQSLSHFAHVDRALIAKAGVYVPTAAQEVFQPMPPNGIAIVNMVPDAPYQSVNYNEICGMWLKGVRVGLLLNPAMSAGLCRVVVVTDSPDSACELGGCLSGKEVQALRVNKTVRAILEEVRGADLETRLRISGHQNLAPYQQKTIQEIGGNRTPEHGFLTDPLRWEHARMLAAVKLF